MLHPLFLLLLVIFIHFYAILTANIERTPLKKTKTGPPYTCYTCFASNCDNPYNATCDDGSTCFTYAEINDGKLYREKGCFKVPFALFAYCREDAPKKSLDGRVWTSTCCNENFCNDDEFQFPNISETIIPSPAPTIQEKQMKINSEEINLTGQTYIAYIVISCSIIASALFSFGMAYFVSTRKAKSVLKAKSIDRKHLKSTSDSAYESVWSSGSGSGKPLLNQRSIYQDVTLIKCIGKGRFGSVWQGHFQGENVAVKIFSSVDSKSWQNEVNIYTDITLFHENVLGYRGSSVISRSCTTELWLLTTYHEQGSLYDYLVKNPISFKQVIEFTRSACAGLLHLHKEIFETKPAIAHRDLKTKNILITSHGTCVLADFGLAVVKSEDSSNPEYPENYKVGTKRYMAPEILDETMKVNSFDSYKQVDMYAFGLILWEVCSHSVEDSKKGFRLAFHDCVPNNPDFEDMKKVVCTELKRPDIPDTWLSNEPLNIMADLMKHCWHKKPEVRYTAWRVKKNLDKVYAIIQEEESGISTV